MSLGRVVEPVALGVVTDPAGGAVNVLAFGGKRPGTRVSAIVVELSPHVLDEPSQCPVGIIESAETSARAAQAAGPFVVADVEFAEAAQVPLDVVQG